MNSLNHRIAGITYLTEWNAWLPVIAACRFGLFRVERTGWDVRHSIYEIGLGSFGGRVPPGTESDQPSGLRIWSEEKTSRLLRSPPVTRHLEKCLERSAITDVDAYLARDLIVIRDFARRSIAIFYTPEFGGYVSECRGCLPQHRITANFGQLFATFLPLFSGFLLHSSGTIRKGKGALFLAPDGGGKTTVLRLSAGGRPLNDDQIIVRREGGSVIAHGTPFGTLTSGPCSAEVRGLFLVEAAPHFEIEPLDHADVLHCLWVGHQEYTRSLPREYKKLAFGVLADVCHQVPAFKLRFQAHRVDWNAIDETLDEKRTSTRVRVPGESQGVSLALRHKDLLPFRLLPVFEHPPDQDSCSRRAMSSSPDVAGGRPSPPDRGSLI